MKNDQLKQLAKGPVWDGNLISKVHRDCLRDLGLCATRNGWNFLTEDGVIMCQNAGYLQTIGLKSPVDVSNTECGRIVKDLEADLSEAINRHSRENRSGTPDWILAGFLMTVLEAAEDLVNRRDNWHGLDHYTRSYKLSKETEPPVGKIEPVNPCSSPSENQAQQEAPKAPTDRPPRRSLG